MGVGVVALWGRIRGEGGSPAGAMPVGAWAA